MKTDLGKKRIKLLAMDIDETLVHRGGEISKRNLEAIKKAEQAGVYVTIATGRGYLGSSRVIKQLGLDTLVVNYGGALINEARTGKTVYATELENELVQRILGFADEIGVHAHLYQGDTIVYEKPHRYAKKYTAALDLPYCVDPDIRKKVWRDVPKVLIITEPERVDELLPVCKEKFGELVCVSASSPGFIEFNRIGANKGTAVAKIAEMLNITRDEVAAIGDNTLDYELIEYAGLGAVVENGNTLLKSIADTIVPSCEEDGVAVFIEEYILKNEERN